MRDRSTPAKHYPKGHWGATGTWSAAVLNSSTRARYAAKASVGWFLAARWKRSPGDAAPRHVARPAAIGLRGNRSASDRGQQNPRSKLEAADAITTASTTVAPFTAAIASPATRAKSGKSGSTTQASSSAATRAERRRHASTMTVVGTVSSYPNCSASFSWVIVRRAARLSPINAPVSRVMFGGDRALALPSNQLGAARE